MTNSQIFDDAYDLFPFNKEKSNKEICKMLRNKLIA